MLCRLAAGWHLLLSASIPVAALEKSTNLGKHAMAALGSGALCLSVCLSVSHRDLVCDGRHAQGCVQRAERGGDCCQAASEAQSGDDQPGPACNMQPGGRPLDVMVNQACFIVYSTESMHMA